MRNINLSHHSDHTVRQILCKNFLILLGFCVSAWFTVDIFTNSFLYKVSALTREIAILEKNQSLVSSTKQNTLIESQQTMQAHINNLSLLAATMPDNIVPVSYTHLTLPTNREV